MAKTRALVKRRKAIRNIRKITRTMELIATARFKKALDRATEAEAYTRKIAELAADLSASATNLTHPLLKEHEQVRNSLLLVICSNRGLCGGYNAAILREANARIREVKAEGVELHLELSGKRAISYYRYQGVPAEATYTHFEDKPRFEEADELADRYIAGYIAGRLDRVEVAYMKFLNAARQVPVVETLLPLSSTGPTRSETPRKYFCVSEHYGMGPGPERGTSRDFSQVVDAVNELNRLLTELNDEAIIREEKLGLVAEVRRGPSGLIIDWKNRGVEEEFRAAAARAVEYEFLPSAANILEEILPVSFKVRLFKCFLDAAVSEQIARRVAMKAATENAGDMIKAITRQYNRARQAQITKEIAEVIGGAEALK